MTKPRRLPNLHVQLAHAPSPFLLRPAIEARFDGRPWPMGVEATIADAIARAVEVSDPSAQTPRTDDKT